MEDSFFWGAGSEDELEEAIYSIEDSLWNIRRFPDLCWEVDLHRLIFEVDVF